MSLCIDIPRFLLYSCSSLILQLFLSFFLLSPSKRGLRCGGGVGCSGKGVPVLAKEGVHIMVCCLGI
jgi:hypothetical protein